nr:hypothetical protein [Tanacetum cinerariifolium]
MPLLPLHLSTAQTSPRTTPSIFLGYPYNHRGYRCLDLNTNKIIISRHVTFDEIVFPFGSMTPTKPPSYQFLNDNLDTYPIALHLLTTPTSPQQTPSQTTQQTNPQITPQSTPPTPLSTPSPQTTSTPSTTPPPPPPPTSQHPMVTRFKVGIMKANPKYNFHVTTSSLIPKSLFHALQDPNWKQAMCGEYKALIDNNTWVLVPLPPNVNIVHSMLLYKHKYNADGSLNRAEAEYRGVANAVAETSCIRNLLRELHTSFFTATLVYYDNVSDVYMSANPVQHQRIKRIKIDIHFVRDKVATGHVRVFHVLSRFQYADIFTKGLSYPLFADFRSSLSVRKTPAPTARAY